MLLYIDIIAIRYSNNKLRDYWMALASLALIFCKRAN